VPVYWQASIPEPIERIRRKIFELVFHPSGRLTADWAQKFPVTVNEDGTLTMTGGSERHDAK
jgi:hypothetical protein